MYPGYFSNGERFPISQEASLLVEITIIPGI